MASTARVLPSASLRLPLPHSCQGFFTRIKNPHKAFAFASLTGPAESGIIRPLPRWGGDADPPPGRCVGLKHG